jgi:hypothetical protein
VTRGDVDMTPVLETLPFSDTIIWDNSKKTVDRGRYGRYLAIQEAKNPIIYFQDDDCIINCHEELLSRYYPGGIIANMPKKERDWLKDTVLVGWGCLFDWYLPDRAFINYTKVWNEEKDPEWRIKGCDWIFPAMTPNKSIDGGVKHLPWYDAPNRTWKQSDFVERRDKYLKRARKARDLLNEKSSIH